MHYFYFWAPDTTSDNGSANVVVACKSNSVEVAKALLIKYLTSINRKDLIEDMINEFMEFKPPIVFSDVEIRPQSNQ